MGLRLTALLVALSVVAAVRSAPHTSPAAAFGPGALVQQVSSDLYNDPNTQHETQVEPDTFAFGNTIVSAFQSGRYYYGLSDNIGWAASTDAGQTWTNGFLPSLTGDSSPPGPYLFASDPAVAYDNTHGVWLISSLVIDISGPASTAIVVSRSADGLTWDAPIVAVPPVGSFIHDKEWIACDNWGSSPYAGRCYLSWTMTNDFRILTSTSLDGGATWGTGLPSADNAAGSGVQPVVQPDGTLVVVYCCMAAFRSTDGGASFGTSVTVSPLQFHTPNGGVRSPPLPSVEVAGDGTLYAAWADCRFRASCEANDIVISTSSDGLSWSAVARVPADSVTSGRDHFVPGLGVDPSTSGSATNLGLVYYYFNDTNCTVSTCELGVGFVFSKDAGATWSVARPLTSALMSLTWIAETSAGRMVADYLSTSFAGGDAVTVFASATAPDPGYHEAMYAATIDLGVDPLPDTDGDACPDLAEIKSDPTRGGQRDPKNPWDYFNPTHDGLNRSDDVTVEVLRYGHDVGDPMYDTRYDRSTLPGGKPWQFGPPDGIIRTMDISAAVRSYGHDCS